MAIDISNIELKQAFDQLLADRGESKTNWTLFGFDSPTDNRLKVVGSGGGGLTELKSQFSPDQVQFGAFRVIGVDDRVTPPSRRPKFVWFTFIGPNVSVVRKARASTQKPDMAKFFNSAQLNVELNRADDLDKGDIAKRLLASGGAHKPTYYEFAPDDLVPVADIK